MNIDLGIALKYFEFFMRMWQRTWINNAFLSLLGYRQTLFKKIRNFDGSILSTSRTQFCTAIKTITLALTDLSLFQPSNT